MRQGFLLQRSESTSQLEQAVREMAQKTTDIGNKADSLSEALTGRPKVQGCFGENFLDSMLANENLIEGLHGTNLQKINEAAQNMIERVAAFYDSYKELGRKLSGVCKEYNDGIVKLREDGRSITTSARQVIQVGNIRRKQGKEFSVPDTPVYLTSPQES